MAWLIDGSYPIQDTIGSIVDVFVEPYPAGLYNIDGGYPFFHHIDDVVQVLSEPYPTGIFIQQNGSYPIYSGLSLVRMGAFTNATNLTSVKIPKSVKYIGEFAFTNTNLSEVTISKDCEYFSTSFPRGCAIKFYD